MKEKQGNKPNSDGKLMKRILLSALAFSISSCVLLPHPSSPSITNSFPHFPLLPFIQTLSHNIV